MRRVKICLFIVMCCLLPLTARAENKKVVINCAELTAIEIEQPPQGFPFSDEACGDKCFYIAFTMNNYTAQRINRELNTYKSFTRELYIEEYLLGKLEPLPIDLPYSQKVSTGKVHQTLESALGEAQEICPYFSIKEPDVVRR